MMRLSSLCDAANGELIGADGSVGGISINTREDCKNTLFVALRGERFDAHEFLLQAVQNGAAAIMRERSSPIKVPAEVGGMTQLLVDDCHQALKDMAAWWRNQFSIPLIGVTGSVGKTTVKEMLGAILSQVGDTLVTQGNLNNEIGVPLTLFRLRQQHRFAVIEMGMNQAGEIARLSAIGRPSIALVNNAAAAHLEGLGSIAAVADAKGEIFSGLQDDGVAVINHDDKYAPRWRELAAAHRQIEFGLGAAADVTASYQLTQDSISMQVTTPDQQFELELALLGKHSVMNVLAAVAVAVAATIPVSAIRAGLLSYQPAQARLNVLEIGVCKLFDDSYNANPASMQAAIEVLAQYPDSLLIVGDMAELGDVSEAEHRRLGELACELGIKRMLACGQFAAVAVAEFDGQKHSFTERELLLDWLRAQQPQAEAILVKGSRSAGMEKVVAELQQQLTENFQQQRRKA